VKDWPSGWAGQELRLVLNRSGLCYFVQHGMIPTPAPLAVKTQGNIEVMSKQVLLCSFDFNTISHDF